MKRLQANVSYSLIHLAMWAAYAIVLSFATNFLLAHSMNAGTAGILIAATAAAACLLQMGLGELLARVRKVKLYGVIIVMGLLIAAGLVAMLSKTNLAAIIGFAVAAVLIQTMPAMGNAIGMDAIVKGAPAIYSIARGIGSASFATGVYVLGPMIEKTGMVTISYAALLTVVVLIAGALWFQFGTVRNLVETKTAVTEKASKSGGNFFKRYPKFALILVAAVFLCISHYMLYFNMQYIIENIGCGVTEQGTATAVSVIVELPVMFGFAFIARKIRCSTLLRFASVMVLVKAAGLLVATTAMGIYAVQATQIVGFGLYAISSVTYAGKVVAPADAVRAQSYLAATINAGSVAATALGGVVQQALGTMPMVLTATGSALIAVVLIMLCAQKTGKNV